ncbi:MAG: hypothetical protein PUI37_10620, partial [Oscillospiraceae bacterium]|nr:hypothetical protein [Oscillospiraceae bacterium]
MFSSILTLFYQKSRKKDRKNAGHRLANRAETVFETMTKWQKEKRDAVAEDGCRIPRHWKLRIDSLLPHRSLRIHSVDNHTDSL